VGGALPLIAEGEVVMGHLPIIRLFILSLIGSSLWSCGTPHSVRPTPTSPTPVVTQPAPPPAASIPSTPPPTVAKPPSPPSEPSQGSIAYLDFRYGFRDLKFGDLLSYDMQMVEEGGETIFYRRPSDDLTIGGAKVNGISYAYYQGRLYAVLVHTKGLVNSRALLDVLRQAYGSGSRPNQFSDNYYWEGSRVFLAYNENPISHDATTLFRSIPLDNEKKSAEKAKARKGASGL
jgi:hypothetical protein